MSIEFSRLPSKHVHIVPPQPHINYQPVCKCCKSREIGGYIGNGTILTDICVKCYRRYSEGKERASQKHQSNNRKGRS